MLRVRLFEFLRDRRSLIDRPRDATLLMSICDVLAISASIAAACVIDA